MKKVDLSNFDIKEYISSIDIEKIKNKLSDKKYERITSRIKLLISSDLKVIRKYLNLMSYYSKDEKDEILKAFNYKGYRQESKFIENFKKLNLKSCPFCNNNYIYFYKKNASEEYNDMLATLEHYYPKADYPHLSLSFYNLIPSCSNCNSKFKGTEEHVGEIIHPYLDDLNVESEFSTYLKTSDKGLNLNIKLNAFTKKAEMTIDRFKLDDVYKEHNDIVKEIWNKAQINSDSRIEELYNSFYEKMGYSKEDVKNMIFCNYLHKDDINKRNHSKLTQDILKQFDI